MGVVMHALVVLHILCTIANHEWEWFNQLARSSSARSIEVTGAHMYLSCIMELAQ